MEQKPVKLRKGMELMKQRGKAGPVRKVVRLRRFYPRSGGVPLESVTLEWTQQTKRKGVETLQETLPVLSTGLPAGYVLAKDRKAKKGGGK